MICKWNNPAFQLGYPSKVLILSFCCHTSPDMTFLFVFVQNSSDLGIECWIVMFKPLRDIFMYRRF